MRLMTLEKNSLNVQKINLRKKKKDIGELLFL